eukprot:COSAG01_NODE_54149_length_334_cov_0.659574_1_plen_89_part_10
MGQVSHTVPRMRSDPPCMPCATGQLLANQLRWLSSRPHAGLAEAGRQQRPLPVAPTMSSTQQGLGRRGAYVATPRANALVLMLAARPRP